MPKYRGNWEDDDSPSVEPIRRDGDPVNTNHDFQRRIENARNRFRKERQQKESQTNE
jgi:hypothetical protein